MNNPLSYSSIGLDIFSKEYVHLKLATGFVVEAGDQYYRITKRHIVAGRDIVTDGQ